MEQVKENEFKVKTMRRGVINILCGGLGLVLSDYAVRLKVEK